MNRSLVPPLARNRETIYISFRTQFENLGDCVINRLLIEELAQSRVVHALTTTAPPWISEQLNRQNCKTYGRAGGWWLSLAREVLDPRVKVVFYFKPGHHVGHANWKGKTKGIALLGFTVLCKLLRIKLRRVGASLGAQTTWSKWIETQVGKAHELYGVRDGESLALAQLLGIPAVYSPDIAFLLPYHNDVSLPRDYLGVSLRARAWNTTPVPADKSPQEILTAMIQAIAARYRLTPQLTAQVTFDRQLTAALAKRLSTDVIEFDHSAASERHIFQCYERCRLVISNRLHSLIFSWSAGAIPVPIVDRSVDQKIVDLFNYLGLGALIFDCEDLDQLEAHVTRLLEHEQDWKWRLKKVFSGQQTELRNMLKYDRTS